MPQKHLFSLLATIIIMSIMISTPCQARKHVEQFNLPTPANYSGYRLNIEASNHSPEVDQAVIFKAQIDPPLSENKVEYQFLINGAPIAEPGMHKVHMFKESGTYKISAVAKLGGVYLINSPPVIIHVTDAWIAPVAEITPQTLTVNAGEEAVFYSLSETDPKSRQWLYWSVSSGHRGSGNKFTINTRNMLPGNYPIELLLKDDRKSESTDHAFLVISNEENPEVLDIEDTKDKGLPESKPLDLQLRASNSHRLEGMPVIYWIQNTQIGADTQLQIDTGDSYVSPWGKRLRYGHSYQHFGIYKAQISAKISASSTQQSNTITVYIWPLWLPVLMVIIGLLLAGIPFFKRYQQQKEEASAITYKHYSDPGHQQIIINSEEETPALRISKKAGNTTQALETVSKGSAE